MRLEDARVNTAASDLHHIFAHIEYSDQYHDDELVPDATEQ